MSTPPSLNTQITNAARHPAVLLILLLLAAPSGAWPQGNPPASDAAPADVAEPPADAVRSATGLVSKVLVAGSGDGPPDPNDLVAVHFIGWSREGETFRNTYETGKHMVFNLQQVFPGWAEGLRLMVVGEKRRLWVPAHLGPPGTDSGPREATFDVELLGIQHVPNPPASLGEPPADAERTISGSYTRREIAGQGEAKPGENGRVLLHYTGWTADGGTFDSTEVRNRPTAFLLDKVMPAFADCVREMVEGETRTFWIPGNIANGEWPGSPQGTLIFRVQLLKILPDDMLQTGPPDVPKGSG